MNEDLTARLAFMQMDAAQRAALRDNRGLIADMVGPALEAFYVHVRNTPETARFFSSGEHMANAKSAQQRHWTHVAEARFDQLYHESVRRIGSTHARIGLEPRWYIGAYALVLESMIQAIAARLPWWRRIVGIFRPRAQTMLTVAIVKAALLDMELSLSIYFEEEQQSRERAVGRLGEALASLAEGDLTNALTGMPATYAMLERSYNETLDKMRTMISAVSIGTARIDDGISEIAGAAENLARRTQSNAASLEETTAAVTQMDHRLRNTAQAADSTVGRADEAILTVEEGRAVANQAVDAMTRVADSAKGIDNVIEGLDKIAFQTRVLAMNAAVEAGRAGEAGRGFAVVADLVSALAMRAEEEAGRARDQLTATQTDIGTAVEAVQKVDGALANISSGVGEVHGLLAGMAQDNGAQAAAVGEISTAIGTMDQATQQNAAMVEQTSAATRSLSDEVRKLAGLTAAFRVERALGPAARGTAGRVAPVPLAATA